MSTSRVPAVIDALVSTLDAALTADVFDGPYITAPDADFVCVGWSPGSEDSANATQEWAGLGNKARDETIDVVCYADSYSGDLTTKTRRDAAYTLLTAVENALRTDPTLGGAIPQPGWAQMGEHVLTQQQTANGLEVGITFHVLVRTRI